MRPIHVCILISVVAHFLALSALGKRSLDGGVSGLFRGANEGSSPLVVVAMPTHRHSPNAGSGGGDTGIQSVSRPALEPSDVRAEASPLPILPSEWVDPRQGYLSGGELDERPRPVGPVELPNPGDITIQEDHGFVILILFVDEDGRVEHADVESANVPLDVQRQAAEAFKGVTMQPGIKNGQPVRSRMKIQVDYDPVGIVGRR